MFITKYLVKRAMVHGENDLRMETYKGSVPVVFSWEITDIPHVSVWRIILVISHLMYLYNFYMTEYIIVN